MDFIEEINDTLTTCLILVNDSDERFFEHFKLGSTRYYALVQLEKFPGLTLSELSQRLLCTKGNMTRILKSMEQAGLLERRADPQDARSVRHVLTGHGLAVLAGVRTAYREILQQRYAGLDAGEAEALRSALANLNRRLESSLRQPVDRAGGFDR